MAWSGILPKRNSKPAMAFAVPKVSRGDCLSDLPDDVRGEISTWFFETPSARAIRQGNPRVSGSGGYVKWLKKDPYFRPLQTIQEVGRVDRGPNGLLIRTVRAHVAHHKSHGWLMISGAPGDWTVDRVSKNHFTGTRSCIAIKMAPQEFEMRVWALRHAFRCLATGMGMQRL